MSYAPGDTFYYSFSLQTGAGIITNADSLPTAILRKNGANQATTVTVTNNATGDYTASVVIPSGWAPGSIVEMIITAIVAGLTQKLPVALGALREVALPATTYVAPDNAGIANIETAIAALPSDVPTVAEIATEVWSNHTPRTVTQSASEVEEAVSGSDMVIRKGTTWSWSLTGLGSIVGRLNLWFTAKNSLGDNDNKAQIQIEENVGLLYIGGSAAASAGAGSLTVDDATAGDLTFTLTDDMTLLLKSGNMLSYDVKWRNAAGKTFQITEAKIAIDPVVTLTV